MKNELLKKAVPHIIAIVIFLIISLIFCKPALEGNELNQHDIVGWKGMAQSAFDYKAQHGHFPLWNTHVFSGMPNYLIAMEGRSILPDLNKVLGLGLPQPVNFFFLSCICFYILCLSLRLRPVVGIFGALAYAFATYNPIIIAAGHVTKMFAIAYMPMLFAGLILTYTKRYWLGLAVTTLGAYLLLIANHPQITYYFFIIAGFVTLAYLFVWIKGKEWKHIGMAAGITVIAVLAGLLTTALSVLTTSEYTKATMRGGKNVEINGTEVKQVETKGLDTAYAFDYSLGKGEALTVIMPNSFGGSARNFYDENSKVVSKLVDKGVPENTAAQISSSITKFWGHPRSTAGGPLYAGVVVCLFALLGLVLYKHPLRWALLAVSIIGVMMALGSNLVGFNLFLFENLPLYNKFRAPSITMVILQLTIPVLAVLGLHTLFFRDNARELLKTDFRKILYAFGGLFVFLSLLYMMINYGSPIDAGLSANLQQMGADNEIIRIIISALKEERKSMFGGQLLRTLGFMALVLAAIWAYMKNILSPVIAVGILAAVTLIDQVIVDKAFLSEENYRPKDEMAAEISTKNAIDDQILADKDPHFRVYDASNVRFSAEDYHASTFHRSIGGYHPAKLRIYQDIIERYLSGGDPSQVLNMLNVKYVIIPGQQQNAPPTLVPNSQAYGPAWFVKTLKVVKDAAEEIQTIGITNLRDTAILQQAMTKGITPPQYDSAATLTLTKYDNDAIEYSSNAATPQFAVFSEIYYPFGWNAYLDGKKVDYVKTDYALRGMQVPAGKHTIRFVFEPTAVSKGRTLSFIGSFLVAIFVLGGLFMHWRSTNQKKQTA
ncbi:YfhO family protein [Ferruginibacter sp.]